MGFIGKITKWIFILCLPVMLLTASIAWAVNSVWLYEYGFTKYNISQQTGLVLSELDKTVGGLIQYFNSEDENISLKVVKDGRSFELFNQREVAHLRDVKNLFWLDYRVMLGTTIYVLSFAGIYLFRRKDRRKLASCVVIGSGLTTAIILALGIGAVISFDQLFLQFHLLSFANDFWQLDPTKDYLIMLFPQGFWYDATLFCALATVVGALGLGGVSVWYLRYAGERLIRPDS